MTIKVLRSSVRRWDLATRMPFKYGIATMTHVPHVFVRLEVQIDGVMATGQAADHLPPKWFTKDPEASVESEIEQMETALSRARAAVAGMEAPSAFALWQALYARLMSPPEFPALLQHFGISLMERALLDAICRHENKPLWKLIQCDRLGIDLGALSPELKHASPSDYLPVRPLSAVTLRHTVGMADFLREAEIPAAEKLDDGLPQSLEACIALYGLHEFKLKLCGEAETDLGRLQDLARVLTEQAPANFVFSLDGNEQFHSPQALHAFGEQVYADPALAAFFDHLSFIEQPIGRKHALADDAPEVSGAWPRSVPLIIDESDGALEDFPRALALGYSGVSHKNCKGVFKGIRNRCLIGFHKRLDPGRRLLMTGEDLANIGPLAMPQDLAVQALLGNASVERNGHHYFTGLSMFPKSVSRQISATLPDLYRLGKDGFAYLTVREGTLTLDTLNRTILPYLDS